MSQDQDVIVHYILHPRSSIQKVDIETNPYLDLLPEIKEKMQILGKMGKSTTLRQIRQNYDWSRQEIIFIKKSFSNKQQEFQRKQDDRIRIQEQVPQKFESINVSGESNMRLMEIIDYGLCIKLMSEQKLDMSLSALGDFYVIHLCLIGDSRQSSVVKKINKKREKISFNRKPDVKNNQILLFGSPSMDEVEKQMNDKIEAIKKEANLKIDSIANDQNAIKSNSQPKSNNNSNTQNQNNSSPQSQTISPVQSNNISSYKPSVTPQSNQNSNDTKKDGQKQKDNQKPYIPPSKQQIEQTLKLSKFTHRSFHYHKEIKQRSIVDFQNSKIQLINAYKDFFYQKEIILKDQTQSKYLKDSLNSLDFNMQIGAPSAALETKIGMALYRSNHVSQQSYLQSQSFSQIHIAYSFQQAFQIQPQSIKLNSNAINSFKQVFMSYLVESNKTKNQNQFLQKHLKQNKLIKKKLQQFFTLYGSQIEVGIYVFGGKYLAQTSFKFLTSLDLKTKEKVRSSEGKFTLQGGNVNLKSGLKAQNNEKQQTTEATQNAIVSRSYILFPGTSKNLDEWNKALEVARQDWKLILKDTKKIFIGEVLANKLNSQEYRLIDLNGFQTFLSKVKEYYEDISAIGKKHVDDELQRYKKIKLFIMWKQNIIRNLRVMKLTPLGMYQKVDEKNKIKSQKIIDLVSPTDRKLNSETYLIDQAQFQERQNSRFTNKNVNTKEKSCLFSSNESFYILLRSKQIESTYSQILSDSWQLQEKREIYDSRIQKFFFKYICCCFIPKKTSSYQNEQKRKNLSKYFLAQHQSAFTTAQSSMQILNLQLQSSYRKLRKTNNYCLPSEVISPNSNLKHLFDLTLQNFQQGKLENLKLRTIPKMDCFNRSWRYQISIDLNFLNKKKGLLNLLQNGHQQKVIVKVKGIRKVNLLGQLIQQNVKQYGSIFYNQINLNHLMILEKLKNID